MLLDQIFENRPLTELVIVRKNGILKHETRIVSDIVEREISNNVLFPISKERK